MQPRGVALYYSCMELMAEEWLDLDWWKAALQIDMGIQDKYYSFGTYCHGGCTSSQKQNNGTKQAIPEEVMNMGIGTAKWQKTTSHLL